MSEQDQHTPESSTSAGYETSDIDIRKTVLWSVIIMFVIAVSIVALWQYFISVREELYYKSVLKPGSSVLRDVRAREMGMLTTYGIIDSTNGVYRIPIDRAMQLLIDEEYAKKQKK